MTLENQPETRRGNTLETKEEINQKLLKMFNNKEGWQKFLSRLSSYKAKVLADDWDTFNLQILLDTLIQYYKVPDSDMADYTAGSIPMKLNIIEKNKTLKSKEDIINITHNHTEVLFNTYRLRGDWIMRYAAFFMWWITSGDLEYLKHVSQAPYETQDPMMPDVPWDDEYGCMFG